MPNQIVGQSVDQIASTIAQFIVEQPDGSLGVDETGFTNWIMEQLGYATANHHLSPAIKVGEAEQLVSFLRQHVVRDRWLTHPGWPPDNAVTTNDAARTRLLQIRQSMLEHAQAMENPFTEALRNMPTLVRQIFNTTVSGKLPAGVPREVRPRFYVCTYLTDRGEESDASPVSVLKELDQNDTATVVIPAPPQGRHINRARLYRSEAGQASAAFFLQGEYAISTAPLTILDEAKATALGEACKTFGWLEPPTNLKGLVSMPNGIMLGYVGDTLHACEPYHPYAWPASYDLPLLYPVVGMVAFGQSVFVGTKGSPYVVTGADSASLSAQIIESNQACVSKNSLCAVGGAVLYASPDGLCMFSGGQVSVVTADTFSKEAWQAYNPHTMFGAEYEGRYFCAYSHKNGTRGVLVFDYESQAISRLDVTVDAMYSDKLTDTLYALSGTSILNLIPDSGTVRTGTWKSKVFRMPRPSAFAWVHVDAEFPGTVTIECYGDGTLVHTSTVTARSPVRMPGIACTEWQFKITSTLTVSGVVFAASTEELIGI